MKVLFVRLNCWTVGDLSRMAGTKRRSVKTAKVICAQCKLQVIEEEEDNIQCDKCSKTFHSICTTLDKRQFACLINDDKEEYVCHMCDETGGNVKSELSIIKTQLSKLNQLDALQESITFMSKQFDEIIKGVAENKKRLDIVQKENKILKTEIQELKNTVKFLNDNRVRNDCLISGLVASESDTAIESVIKTFDKVGVSVKPEEIEEAFFIRKNKNANKQTVVAKFNSKGSKQKVMNAKVKLYENECTKSVYVNDFLSKETLTLLNYAKALKAVGYSRVYASGGRVLTKKSEMSKPLLIRSNNEVDELLLQSTTNRVHGRKSVHQTRDDESGDDVNAYMSPV